MTLAQQQRQSMGKSGSNSSGRAAISPTNTSIKSVLLSDGWHEVSGDCQYHTQYAISPSNSDPAPNSVYAAIEFTDAQSGKKVFVPVSKILAVEPSDS